ncbi:uncharacterized protein LOC130739220 [Lotus japonicus]|uniref:uncharacterized protein LOC130739220 n=1 Tax=Lotus japonicus TaxID=34305 RepID=UPI00258D51A8|nr:uncharacterized protein LOC130739220 [Lotus japonicus]
MQQIEQQQESNVDSFLCPSFSTYSTNKLNDIAERVTRDQNDNEENDFEFVAFRKGDGVYIDGQSARVFPIFNRENLTTEAERHRAGEKSSGAEENTAAIRVAFGSLLVGNEEEGSDRSTSSSSEEEVEVEVEVEGEMEAVAAGSFCLWTPKSVQASASPSRCKKSNSTGSSTSTPSKRWKLLSFLRRSNSEGVRLSSSSSSSLASNSVKKGAKLSEGSTARVAGKMVPVARNGGGKKAPAAALEGLYVRKGEIIRRKSYLSYRQELGFGVGLNAIGRGFPLQ